MVYHDAEKVRRETVEQEMEYQRTTYKDPDNMTQDTTQQLSRNVLQVEEHAVNNGFALALPGNYYDLSDREQYRILADVYDTLIEYYGWV